jgi:sulfate adenylyltransferase subunit 1
MDLLRINTAGSVDDGKSTLIGRLLYDTHSLTQEQEALIARRTAEKGMADLDFSVITDGLIAEREQGITIDVAHIYFSTASRKFIIADSPGHIEYTRNMVTGASNSEVSVILIDARKGLLEQSYRHFFISQLLRVQAVVFCVNKMDLVGYSEDTFLEIGTQIEQMIGASARHLPTIHVLPISSLKGDNVVHASENMPWYEGPTLDALLHHIQPSAVPDAPFRMEIQQVLHVQNEQFKDFRGFAGRIASGDLNLGDRVLVLPSGREADVVEIRKYNQVLTAAGAGDSVIVSLSEEVDASRGSLFVKVDAGPLDAVSSDAKASDFEPSDAAPSDAKASDAAPSDAKASDAAPSRAIPSDAKTLRATIVWLDERPAAVGGKYLLQAGARSTQVKLQEVAYLIPPEQPLSQIAATGLALNDIAAIELRLAQPIYLDVYAENKANGAFILVDLQSNHTCGVGFVEAE